jgi:4-amino-4-deoxy-L-arabinose transferase-like glycosyltransferase
VTRRDRTLIGAVALASLLPFLGQTRDLATHELRHAEIAREIAETGRGLVPTLLGREYVDKPPVMHLMIAGLYRLTGRQSLALARLPSAIAAVAGALALYGIGLALADRRIALVAALLLLGTFEYHLMGRVARPDMLFVAAILGACLANAHAMRARDRWRRIAWIALAGGSAGLATITKGPLGTAIPALFTLLAPMGRSDLSRFRLREWALFVGGAVAVVIAWALAAALVGGGDYVRRVIVQPDVTGSNDVQAWYAYLPMFVRGFLPLTLLLPVVVRGVRRRGWTPALMVSVILLVALSAVPKKRPHYLLPIYPFLALAVAESLDGEPRWLKRAACALVAAWLAAGPLYYAIVPLWPGPTEEPKLVAGREILALVEPGRPIVCMDELAEAIALQGHRMGVAQELRVPGVVTEAEKNGPGSYIAIPAELDERLRKRALGRLTLAEVAEVSAPLHRRTRSWRLYRVTTVGH